MSRFGIIFSLLFLLSSLEATQIESEKHYLSEKMMSSFLEILTSEAFQAEFDFEKNRTRENSKGIESLTHDIEILAQNFSIAMLELSKRVDEIERANKESKIQESTDTVFVEEKIENSEKSKELELKIDSLAKSIEGLKELVEINRELLNGELKLKNIESSKTSNNITFKLISKRALIKLEPTTQSKNIGEIERDEVVEIEYCNRFKWCKLANRDGYVAKYLFIEIE